MTYFTDLQAPLAGALVDHTVPPVAAVDLPA